MRVFWAIVGGLIVLAVVVSISGGGRAGAAAATGAPIERATVGGQRQDSSESERVSSPARETPAETPSGPGHTPLAASVAPTIERPRDAAIELFGPPEPTEEDRHTAADSLEALAATAINQPEPKPVVSDAPPDLASPPVGTGGEGKPFEWPDDPAFPPDKYVESKAVRRADGAILLDDRFIVRGAGTADDPYRVTWELLVSAQEVYRPRAGQKKLPRRVTFLHNKHVRLAGFVAFPIASNNPRECLVMLNEWDGCCIGVMPTAFDAVEVRLGKAATADQRLATHGELRGVFKVDPFEDAGWLISLYLMDDGTLKADQ